MRPPPAGHGNTAAVSSNWHRPASNDFSKRMLPTPRDVELALQQCVRGDLSALGGAPPRFIDKVESRLSGLADQAFDSIDQYLGRPVIPRYIVEITSQKLHFSSSTHGRQSVCSNGRPTIDGASG